MVKLAVHIRHVHIFEKGGRTYIYFRKGKKKVRILRDPRDVDGIRRDVAKIEADINAGRPHEPQVHATGTLGAVLVSYRLSTWFTSLKPATRKSYERAFALLEPHLDRAMEDFDRATILALRDRLWHPRFGIWAANNAVTIFGILFKFARDTGAVKIDPLAERVRKIRKPKGGTQPNRPWSAEERAVVLAEAPAPIRLALALAMCTGLRKADLFAVTMADVRDGDIAVVTSKRDEPVALPIHPVLADALAQRPGEKVGRIVVRADGIPYTPDGFDSVWHRFRGRLEAEGKIQPGLTLHGLRHTLGTMLKEAGMADGDIADVLGQATVSMARHYSKNARLADATREKIVGLRIKG